MCWWRQKHITRWSIGSQHLGAIVAGPASLGALETVAHAWCCRALKWRLLVFWAAEKSAATGALAESKEGRVGGGLAI